MLTPPDWVKNHVIPRLGATPVRVLAVEGLDDLKVYERWLDKLAAELNVLPSSKVLVVETAGKTRLIGGLEWLRDHAGDPAHVFGLVDRDEWTSKAAQLVKQALPRLLVNESRHCLESYFCDPDELDAALQSRDVANYGPELPNLRIAIGQARETWVPHWALWVTLQRAHAELTHDGQFPNNFHGQHPLPADAEIKRRLAAWSKTLDPKHLFTGFDQLRTSALKRNHRRQFRECIYSKDFYPQIVKPLLLKLDPAIDPDDWPINLADWSPDVPADIRMILDPLLL
ncbi:MAG TPA: hypothetical protein VGM05_17605 [Planctomycetaceae bacterium]|jgi:hypothetical protein